ncbi:MAG TPA: alpha/beta hydrolase-fold protein [Thermoanaerobaculia bacterium]|nr:alpha/beta hydrolase-fold protein [Thermoanaerobaculia bacterium]
MRRMHVLTIAVFVCASLRAAEPVQLTIDSKIMGEKRTAFVSLPASYATSTHRYPVLYMTDAPQQFDHTVATAAFLANTGRMPEVIVVGVTNTDRTRDLTPTHIESDTWGGRRMSFPTSGGAAKFLSFFESELIPQIESSYRTIPYRVFAGHSFGGLFALNALFTKPKLFNAVIAVSPTFVWDDGWVLRSAQKFVAGNPDLNASLVVTLGDEGEMKTGFEDLKKLMSRRAPRGFTSNAYYFGDEDHGSVVLPSHHAALKTIFAPWSFHIRPEDDVKTLYSRAKQHYAELSKRIGTTVSVPEQMGNQIGYLLLNAKANGEAIEVFRANAAAYPGSANVYDSLGEALELTGDREGAKTSYAKAVEIAARLNSAVLPVYRKNLERVSQ